MVLNLEHSSISESPIAAGTITLCGYELHTFPSMLFMKSLNFEPYIIRS